MNNTADINYFKDPLANKTGEEAFKNRLPSILESHENELKKKLIFNTIADAQAYSGFVAGDIIEVLGYYSKNDGAGHYRKIESSDNGTGILIGGLWANLVIEDTINILNMGAKITPYNNTDIFEKIDLLNKTIYVPNGVYFSFYNPKNKVIGEGSLKITNKKISIDNKKEFETCYNSFPLSYDVSNYSRYVFIGDSITYGYGVNVDECYTNLIAKTISDNFKNTCDKSYGSQLLNRADEYYGVTGGNGGINKSSKILSNGGYIKYNSLSGNYIALRIKKSSTVGNLEIFVDGISRGIISTTGATGENALVYNFTIKNLFKNKEVKVVAVGGVVELTSIEVFTNRNHNIEIVNHSQSGFNTTDFEATKTLLKQELEGSLMQNVVILALGTNDIYSPDKKNSSDIYIQNLESIYNEIKNVCNVIFTVPLIPNNSVYNELLEPLEIYRTKLYKLAKKYNSKVIDLTEINTDSKFGILTFYQNDGLHPNLYGNRILATKYLNDLFSIKTKGINKKQYFDIILNNPCTETGGDYEKCKVILEDLDKVSFTGLISLNNLSVGSKIFDIDTVVSPNKTKVLNCIAFNGGFKVGNVTLVFYKNGSVIYFGNDFVSPNVPEYVSLDGLTYTII